MALNMVFASNQFCRGSAPVTTTPLTMACWVKPASTTTNHAPMWIGDALPALTGTWTCWFLQVNASRQVSAQVAVHPNFNGPTSTKTLTVGVWGHICGVYTSATARTIYVDGGDSASDATSRNPTGVDGLTIGGADVLQSGAGANYFNGDLADVAIWNQALTPDEVAGLGRGVNPLAVRPGNLVRYWPLGLTASGPDFCWVSGLGLTRINTPIAVGTANPPTSKMRV